MANPRIIRVEARDVCLTLEIGLDFLKNMAKVIEMSEFQYDSTKPEEVAIHDFLNGELYPFLEGTIKGVEEQNGS